jgi:hypothetical protein
MVDKTEHAFDSCINLVEILVTWQSNFGKLQGGQCYNHNFHRFSPLFGVWKSSFFRRKRCYFCIMSRQTWQFWRWKFAFSTFHLQKLFWHRSIDPRSLAFKFSFVVFECFPVFFFFESPPTLKTRSRLGQRPNWQLGSAYVEVKKGETNRSKISDTARGPILCFTRLVHK